MSIHDAFWPPLLTKLGAPVSPWNMAVMDFWASQEGGPSNAFWINNPFASTQPGVLDTSFNIGYGPGVWNSVGVKVYASPDSGVQNTYAIMTNGFYPNILRCLRDQQAYPEVVRDFDIWINGPNATDPNRPNYGPSVLHFMQTTTASKSAIAPVATGLPRAERLLGGYGIKDKTGNTLTGEAALKYMDDNQYSLLLAIQSLRDTVTQIAFTVQSMASGAATKDQVVQVLAEIIATYQKGQAK